MKRLKGKHLRLLIAAIMYLELCVTGSFSQADLQSSLPADQLTGEDETISINVKDIEIGDFFSAIARRRKINIVLGKNVSGTISVNLHNVPLTKALYAISRANEYQCIKKNGIYYILEENEGSGSNSNKKSELSSTVKSFRVNYAEISGVRKLIEDIVGEDSVAVHQEAKTLIVNDTMENIAKVEKILKSVDYPPHQVLIEAKILEIQLGDNLSFGVDWEKRSRQAIMREQ